MDTSATVDGGLRGPPGDAPGILFVTEALFLPKDNGSSQVYSSVADSYAQQGWRTFCVSFYRDSRRAGSPSVQESYRNRFNEFLLLPGWNLGGRWCGKAGMAWRELERWMTGNVFASHPFLLVNRIDIQNHILGLLRRNQIDTVYFHKPHTLLLMRPLLPALRSKTLIVDLHDDFVVRAAQYNTAYTALFSQLRWRDIVQNHRSMYVRHKLSWADAQRSRQEELALLETCDQIRVASESEYHDYTAMPTLANKVVYHPWSYVPEPVAGCAIGSRPPCFDAGFVAAGSVMNLDAVINLRDEILPRVRMFCPDFRLLIAGTIADAVRPLLRDVDNVEVHGRLGRISDFYSDIGAAVIPLRHGTGVSIKALEALSYNRPVISSPIGVRGISAEALARVDVTVANTPADFADAMVRFARLRKEMRCAI